MTQKAFSTNAISTVTLTATNLVTALDFNSTSDKRLKTNITEISGLDIVNKLKGYEFDFLENGKHAAGVMAQEIEEVLPHVVTDLATHKTVSYAQIIPYLIEAIKELSKEVNDLKNQLDYK